jgi:hypothetical protein
MMRIKGLRLFLRFMDFFIAAPDSPEFAYLAREL